MSGLIPGYIYKKMRWIIILLLLTGCMSGVDCKYQNQNILTTYHLDIKDGNIENYKFFNKVTDGTTVKKYRQYIEDGKEVCFDQFNNPCTVIDVNALITPNKIISNLGSTKEDGCITKTTKKHKYHACFENNKLVNYTSVSPAIEDITICTFS